MLEEAVKGRQDVPHGEGTDGRAGDGVGGGGEDGVDEGLGLAAVHALHNISRGVWGANGSKNKINGSKYKITEKQFTRERNPFSIGVSEENRK